MSRTAKCLGVLVLFAVALAAAYVVAGMTGLLLTGCIISSAAAIALAAVLYRRNLAHAALQPMHHRADQAVQDEQTFDSWQPMTLEQTWRRLNHDSRDVLQQSQACLELLALKTRGQPELQELVTDVQKSLDRLLRLYENARRHSSTSC
jgi:hypothetical protein